MNGTLSDTVDSPGLTAGPRKQPAGPAPGNEFLLREKRIDLKRMRRLATGLLVLMTALFIVARIWEGDYGWLGYVRAFAEAAMIGALADWFAVTAIFRHPLGIPIPHTAIIQKNKDRIGRSLGDFVQKNFLTEEVLREKLETVDIAGQAADWLASPENSAQVADRIALIIPEILLSMDDERVHRFIDTTLSERLGTIEAAPLAGNLLTTLTHHNRHQALLDTSLRIAADFLDRNKTQIREKIRRESPWFVPGFVDNKIYEKIINKIEETLIQVNSDPEHELRAQFDKSVLEFIERLKSSPEYREKGEALKQDLLQSPKTKRMLRNVWHELKDQVLRDIADPESHISARIREGVRRLGENLQRDENLRLRLNAWIRDTTISVTLQRRAEIGRLISDTVERWDGETLTERVEVQVGRDLQFIRINGTVVGGLVGLVLYIVSHWVF